MIPGEAGIYISRPCRHVLDRAGRISSLESATSIKDGFYNGFFLRCLGSEISVFALISHETLDSAMLKREARQQVASSMICPRRARRISNQYETCYRVRLSCRRLSCGYMLYNTSGYSSAKRAFVSLPHSLLTDPTTADWPIAIWTQAVPVAPLLS